MKRGHSTSSLGIVLGALLLAGSGCTDESERPDRLELYPQTDTSMAGTFDYQGDTYFVGSTFDAEEGRFEVNVENERGEFVLAWRANASSGDWSESPARGPAFDVDTAQALAAHVIEWDHIEYSEAQHLAWQTLLSIAQIGALEGESTPSAGPAIAQNCGTGNDCWFRVGSEYCAAHDLCCDETGWLGCVTICWSAAAVMSLDCQCSGSGDTATCTGC